MVAYVTHVRFDRMYVCMNEQTTAVEESSAAVRELFYETLNSLREEEKKIKAEAWMFEGERHR